MDLFKKALEDCLKILRKRKWLAVFLLGMPFINETFPTSYFIYIFLPDIFKVVSFAVLVYLFIKQRRKISKLTTVLLISLSWWVIATVLNYADYTFKEYVYLFYDVICMISLALLVELFKEEPTSLIDGLMANYEVALYSYFISVVFGIATEGYYLRGLLNTLVLWMIPGVCLAFLYMVFHKKFIRPLCLLFVCLFIIKNVKSATMIVSLFGMICVIIAGYLSLVFKKTKRIKFPLALLMAIAFGANLFVLFIYMGKNSFPFIDYVIERILHRSTNFTQRDSIWNESFLMIAKKPFFGYGYRPSIFAENSFAEEFPHAHNQLLQKLLESGIPGLLMFLLFHIILVLKVDKGSNTIARIIVMAAIFGISITYITEAYNKSFVFYPVYYLTYHINRMWKSRKKEDL